MMLIKRARMTTSMGVGRLAGIENTPAGRPARRHHSSLHVRDKAAAPRQPGLRDREDLVHEQSEKGSSAGWKVGTAAELLSLNEQEGAFVEMKLVLARFDGWLRPPVPAPRPTNSWRRPLLRTTPMHGRPREREQQGEQHLEQCAGPGHVRQRQAHTGLTWGAASQRGSGGRGFKSRRPDWLQTLGAVADQIV